MPLMKVNMPANAAALFSFVMQIAAYEMIPTDDIFTVMLDKLINEAEPV